MMREETKSGRLCTIDFRIAGCRRGPSCDRLSALIGGLPANLTRPNSTPITLCLLQVLSGGERGRGEGRVGGWRSGPSIH